MKQREKDPKSLMKSFGLTRRRFIHGSALAGIVGRSLPMAVLQMLVQGRFSKLQAEDQGVDSRRYLQIHLQGGAPGWNFHLPLTPFAGQSFVANRSCTNNFVGGQPVYSTTPITVGSKTFYMPHLWAATIPVPGGGNAPMRNLMDNALFCRGFENSFDSHEVNTVQIQRPDPSGRSLSGTVADSVNPAEVPIPAISLEHPTPEAYSSKKIGLKHFTSGQLGSGNFLRDNLMAPFQEDTLMTQLLTRRDAFEAAFQDALALLQVEAIDRNLKTEGAFGAVASAESLIRRNFGDLVATYASLRAKYVNLIERSATIQEILTNPVDPALDNFWRRAQSTDDGLATNPDLRNVVLATSRVTRLAETFAVTEFLFTNDLAAAVNAGVGAATGLNIPLNIGGTRTTIDGGWDQHPTGSALALVVNAFTYRALAACLYEFINVLKAQGKFDDTVIHLCSEFTRAPRDVDGDGKTGTGSDHGWRSNHFALFSGAIKTPNVIGNIIIDAEDHPTYPAAYLGTWGVAGNTPHDGNNKPLNWGHAASTVAEALGIPSPMPNFHSVIQEHPTQGLIATIEDAENNDYEP